MFRNGVADQMNLGEFQRYWEFKPDQENKTKKLETAFITNA